MEKNCARGLEYGPWPKAEGPTLDRDVPCYWFYRKPQITAIK